MSKPSSLPRVVAIEVFGAHELRLTFNDGLVREFRYEPWTALAGGVFGPLADPDHFARVVISGRTIAWPNEVDLDPDVLHGDHESEVPSPFKFVRQYQLEQAS